MGAKGRMLVINTDEDTSTVPSTGVCGIGVAVESPNTESAKCSGVAPDPTAWKFMIARVPLPLTPGTPASKVQVSQILP